MAGFAGLIGGLGNGAMQYGEGVRNRQLHEWTQRQQMLSQGLHDMLPYARTPEMLEGLIKARSAVTGTRPGDPIEKQQKVLENAMSYLQVHPQVAAAMAPPPDPNKLTPAPAPGKSPGTGNMADLISSTMGNVMPKQDAQPATSPVQPQAQGGSIAPVSPPAQASASPQAAAGQPSPLQTGAAGAAASPPQTTGMGPVQSSVMGLMDRANQQGWMPASVQQDYQPFATNEAELARQRDLAKFELTELPGLRQQAIQKIMGSTDPSEMTLPQLIQMESLGKGGGLGMASLYRMMNTEKPMRSVDAGALSPEEKAMYGIPADAKGSYILRQNAFTHEFTGAVPQSMGTANTYNAQGQAGVADKRAALNNGGALPAVGGGPSYNPTEIRLRPVGIDAATGRNKFMTPLELAASGRGLGGYSSSMIPSVRSSSVSQGTNGETNTSSTSHKVLPNILHVDASGKYPALDVPIPGAKSSEPSTASSINTPIKPFNPSDRIDNLVRLMGQDAANERLLYGRDKVAVTNRMAQLGIDPNNATGSMRDQAARAGLVLDHLKTINQIINKAEADGDLGLVASRWNDFLTNKLGKDPTKTQVFSKLSSQLGFLSTAIAMTHGGLRAGSSEPVIEHWQKVLYAQDPDTLRSKLAQATNWMQGYYGLVGSGKQAGGSKNDVTITPVTPSAQPVDSNKVNDFLKRHGIQ